MHIYFSGIGGVGIGPLAQIALDAGYDISGSDLHEGPLTKELIARGVPVAIGQDGSHIAKIHTNTPIDWFVYTAALPHDHAELTFARDHSIRATKRDELLAEILKQQNTKMIAVAGTHGKTTTTAMLVWIAQKIGLPTSYSIGSTISFGPSGKFDAASPYFFYECDEYDRNFLHFTPHLSLITSLDYDHPDTYKTEADYNAAFTKFLGQSENSILWREDSKSLKSDQAGDNTDALPGANTLDDSFPILQRITLAGAHNRKNGALAVTAISRITNTDADDEARWNVLLDAINSFPGTSRRFEKLGDNLYSDYGHHPKEIAATLQLAREISDHVVLVYQPHQNTRQHHIIHDYKDAFSLAERIYWLPTYLSREDTSLPILSPQELIDSLSNKEVAVESAMDDALWTTINAATTEGKLVLLMGAGSIDEWARHNLSR